MGIVMRISNWPKVLHQVIDERRGVPFSWGENDCALFAADVVQALTGTDYASSYRGRYSTAIGSVRVLNNDKTSMEDLVTVALGQPVSPALLQRGDVAQFDNGNGKTLGICVGRHIVSPGTGGLEWVNMSYCLQGWKV